MTRSSHRSPILSLTTVLGLALLVCILAITTHSLWIDELMTVFLVKGDTFAEFQQRLGVLSTSDNLMPFYMGFVHFWETALGDGERVLRLANVPWFLFGVGAMWHLLRESPRLRWLSVALLFASPFTWYYLNEARPYAMQIGSGCAVMACAVRIIWTRQAIHSSDLIVTAIGLLVMSGASLLSVPWTGLFILLFLWALKSGRVVAPKGLIIGVAVASTLVLAGLGYYYAGVLATGARAATAFGGIFQGLAYAAYELAGFAGLGPGRDDLRANGVGAFALRYLAVIAILTLIYFAIAVAAVLDLRRSTHWRKPLLVTLGLLMPAFAFFLLLGIFKDFRVLGRHFAPLSPVIAMALAGTLLSIRMEGTRRVLSIAALLALSASTLSIRLAPRHLRDDYRQAKAVVEAEYAAGRNVLWVANLAGISHYTPESVPQGNVAAGGMFVYFFGEPKGSNLPDTVLISKPDIHDPVGFGRKVIEDGNYRLERSFPGFQVWVR